MRKNWKVLDFNQVKLSCNNVVQKPKFLPVLWNDFVSNLLNVPVFQQSLIYFLYLQQVFPRELDYPDVVNFLL